MEKERKRAYNILEKNAGFCPIYIYVCVCVCVRVIKTLMQQFS